MISRGLLCLLAAARVVSAQGEVAIPLIPLDERVAAWMREPAQHRSAALGGTLTGARMFGDVGAIALGAALWGGGALAKDNTTARDGVRALEAIAVGSALTILVKRLAGRARPSASPGNAHDFSWGRGFGGDANFLSFPSGHSTAAFAFASAITARVGTRSRSQALWLGPLLYGAASLTGVSRLYDGSHWLSDVVVGAGIGTVSGLLLVRQADRRP